MLAASITWNSSGQISIRQGPMFVTKLVAIEAPLVYSIDAPTGRYRLWPELIEKSVSPGANRKYRIPCASYQAQISDRIEKGGLSMTTQPAG